MLRYNCEFGLDCFILFECWLCFCWCCIFGLCVGVAFLEFPLLEFDVYLLGTYMLAGFLLVICFGFVVFDLDLLWWVCWWFNVCLV